VRGVFAQLQRRRGRRLDAFWQRFWSRASDAHNRAADADGTRRRVAELVALLPDVPLDLLDLGCGSGEIHTLLAPRCRSYVGVDYSQSMLARFRRRSPAARLIHADLRSLPEIDTSFNAALCDTVCQFISPSAMTSLLKRLSELLPPGAVCVLGNVPDAALRWHYYGGGLRGDRPFRVRTLLRTALPVLLGGASDGIGYWHGRHDLAQCARRCGFEATMLSSMTHEYRFHAVLTRRATSGAECSISPAAGVTHEARSLPPSESTDSCAAIRVSGRSPAPAPMETSASAREYDDLVTESPQGSLFASRWWLEAVAPGRMTILREHRGEALVAAWPIIREEGNWGRFGRAPLTPRLGILLAPSRAKYAEALSREHDVVESICRQVSSESRAYQAFHESFSNGLAMQWAGFRESSRYTYVLENLADEDLLWTNLRAPCRTAIRKAQARGLSIADVALDEFAPLHEATYARQGLAAPIDDLTLRRVDDAAQARGARMILGALDASGSCCAAVYVAWSHGTAHYLMAGADERGRRDDALRWLLWEAIRACRAHAHRFDFEGSMMRGPEDICRDFGARLTRYPVFHQPLVEIGSFGDALRHAAKGTRAWWQQRRAA